MLTEAQRECFLTRGYVRLGRGLPITLAERWWDRARERIAAEPGRVLREHADGSGLEQARALDLEDPSSWYAPRITYDGGGSGIAMAEELPEIWAAVGELMGGHERVQTTHWGDYLAINLDRGDRGEADVTQWHWDDPQRAATLADQRLGLVVLALLTDVAPGGGGTLLAPESLAITSRLLAEHPDGVDLGALETRGRVLASCEEIVEVTGAVGETWLVHPFVLHARGEAAAPALRVLANPNLFFREPMRLDPRAPGDSLVERAVLRALGRAEAVTPGEDPSASIPRRLAEGDVLGALALQDALARSPDAAPRWLAEALVLGLLGRTDEAWERMRRCLAWSAVSPSAAIAFASALDRPGLATPVLEDLRTRGARRDETGSQLELASAAWMLGLRDEARAEASGLATAELEPALRVELADLLERLGLFDVLARALARWDEDGAAEPELVGRRARLALWRADAEEADRLGARLEGVWPERALGPRLRGAAAVLSGATAEACEALDRALERAPRDVEAMLWRAEAAQAQGRLGEANDWLGRAVREGGQGFALGVLRARVEAAMLDEASSAAPPGLARALSEPDAIERRYGIARVDLERWSERGEDLDSPADRCAVTARVLEALGGNRTPRPTIVEGGTLKPLEVTASVRRRSDEAIQRVAREPDEEVEAALHALVEARPDSPHPRCYRGELRLWRGELDAALADFRAAREIRDARWAHVGEGAVWMLRGRWPEAMAAFDATEAFGPVAGATTHVYRGEALRRAGELEAARGELTIAATARPSRVGAWVNLALLGEEGAEQELRERAPALLHLAGERLGRERPAAIDRELLETCLALMAGNRSSRILSVAEAGRLRVLPPSSRIVAFCRAGPRLLRSAARSPATIEAAEAVAGVLARAPRLPAPLPMLGLRLLAVQRHRGAIDLVIGRVVPLGRIRVRGAGDTEALVPQRLERSVASALGRLAERMAEACTEARWREAQTRASQLPEGEAPI